VILQRGLRNYLIRLDEALGGCSTGESTKVTSISINDEDSPGRHLKRRWDEEDAARDERERQAKRAFLEQEANELFAPVENHLTRLGRVLHAANAVVEVNPTWEHLGEQKLRRTAKVIFRGTAEYLPLDFTIEGVTIFL
jgi:hypothetical protein